MYDRDTLDRLEVDPLEPNVAPCAGRGLDLSETTEELCSRLGALIEEWNNQFSQSHSVLTEQVVTARTHLQRLAQPLGDDVVSPDIEEARSLTVSSLQAEIDDLKAALRQAHEAAPPLVGGGGTEGLPEDSSPSSEELQALSEELAQAQLEVERLTDVLASREQELAELRSDTEATPSSEGDFEAAYAALQATHAETLARLEELEASNADLREASAIGPDGTVQIKAFDSQGHKKRMGEILLELGVLDETQLKGILKEQSLEPQHRLGALVVAHGYTGEDIVAKILAAQLRLPYVDARDETVDPEAVALVSAHVTQLHHCLPLRENDGVLTVAMVNPLDLIAIEDLELASQRRVSPVVSTRPQIEARLEEVYGSAD